VKFSYSTAAVLFCIMTIVSSSGYPYRILARVLLLLLLLRWQPLHGAY
jgi:hypothetical protein